MFYCECLGYKAEILAIEPKYVFVIDMLLSVVAMRRGIKRCLFFGKLMVVP